MAIPVTSPSADAISGLMAVASQARSAYAARVAETSAYTPWWTAVIITASSARQAERYAEEIRRRREGGRVPAGVVYLVVPDLDDERIGSGGATLNALRVLAEAGIGSAESLETWWATQRVLIIHSGGDSRRLPQYSLSGKLFSALPITTPWGEVSTVFDEMLGLSTAWAMRLDAGLVVASGDVILTFDAGALHWDRPGVSGVAMREPVAVGSQHGVYVADEQGRVYTFLQKPTAAEVRAAGGLLADDNVALDTGLIRFDAPMAARLTGLAGVTRTADGWACGPGILARTAEGIPAIDLYEHMTLGLTGQWAPKPEASSAWHLLAEALHGVPFWCDLVDGEFTHVGTTRLFRQLMTEETHFSRLYDAQQRLGVVEPAGMRSAGVIVDSVLAGGGELGPGAIAIECDLAVPVQAGRGAILHGLAGLPDTVTIPPDTVVHQVPIVLPDGRRGTTIRVYGVEDDPKGNLASCTTTWLGRPFSETLAALGLAPDAVWPEVPPAGRTLWNAQLFPLGTLADTWACAQWMLGQGEYPLEAWEAAPRLSLADSAKWADSQALAEAHTRRLQASWQQAALGLAKAGSDLRPLLATPPGITALAATGKALVRHADALVDQTPTEAASQYFHASRFLGHAGLAAEAERTYAEAFACVQLAVTSGMQAEPFAADARGWQHDTITVSAPARIDLGGGWSDTPPFCLDWGGTVLNMAVDINGSYPIRTTLRRLEEPVIRCVSGEAAAPVEYRTLEELLTPPGPGCPFSIPRAALRLSGLFDVRRPLAEILRALGGGLEISTAVALPMGSGLGTSSILAVTVVQGLAAMLGVSLGPYALSAQVMRLEQVMTTGGGWQDQAGGIFPGAKLLMTGPGLRQRLRVQPVGWSAARQQEFSERCVLYYTGIRRIAKNLLAQVVGSYLAREVATVQVLHSIKTLAVEMAYAMSEGEWEYLGELINRHWELNLALDPHMTNAPINALLESVRPYLAGAKLAGAGGGGFMILLAKDPEAAAALCAKLAIGDHSGAVYNYTIAQGVLQ